MAHWCHKSMEEQMEHFLCQFPEKVSVDQDSGADVKSLIIGYSGEPSRFSNADNLQNFKKSVSSKPSASLFLQNGAVELKFQVVFQKYFLKI